MLVGQLCSQSHLNAIATLPNVQIPSRDDQSAVNGQAPTMVDDHQSAINECHSHRTLLSLLFKFSQHKKSYDKLTKSSEVVHWVLNYLHLLSGLFTKQKHMMNPARNLPAGSMSLDSVPLAVSHTLENALGLLQNVSLKPIGIDRILHFKIQPP